MNLFRYAAAAFLVTAAMQADETLHYVSVTAGKRVTTEWTIEEKGDKLLITGKSSDNSMSILETSKDYTLEKFTQKDPNKGYDLVATRQGNMLSVTGKVKQRDQTERYDINTTPWVQEFAFGFKDFLNSNKREYKFEILRPEDLDMHDMIVSKEDIEELKIDDVLYTTQKMKITLQGFKRRFWKAEIWYDTATHRMLRYKANEGPGTPVTETVLIKTS